MSDEAYRILICLALAILLVIGAERLPKDLIDNGVTITLNDK